MAAASHFPQMLIVMAAAPALAGELIANAGRPMFGIDAQTIGGTLVGVGIALMAGVIAQGARARAEAGAIRTSPPACLRAGSGQGASSHRR